MRNLFSKLWNDDAGVVTIEYLVLGTFLGLALIVGVATLSAAINAELIELGNAVMHFDQGFETFGPYTKVAIKTGSEARDRDFNVKLKFQDPQEDKESINVPIKASGILDTGKDSEL
jgi:Flp pilus assembly pilin Flp